MSDWTWEYVPDAANVVGGLAQAQIDCVTHHDAKVKLPPGNKLGFLLDRGW
jgi:hypothetical protein